MPDGSEETVMPYVQTDRPIQITTPLGENKMFATALRGREALSELFHFELETIAELGTDVAFDKMLGKLVTVTIMPRSDETSEKRYFNGMVKRMAQGERTEEFTRYYLEIVPQFWLQTRVSRSRIFQQKTVPDILKEVLTGLDVSWEIQGDFKSREYCVQFQETDFNFACRLMEEEGIFYFFKHTQSGHQMVLANTPQSHPDIPYSSTVHYEEFFGHAPQDERIYDWSKAQEIRSGKYTVWDEHFQLPYKNFAANKSILDSVQVGRDGHKLAAGGGASLEVYEFPGEYSRHFDGINKGGGDQADHLQWIFDENSRTVDVRMQQEAAQALLIEAKSGHAGLTAGHRFTLKDHFSDDGKFVLTGVEHEAKQPIGVESEEEAFTYQNSFTCIPAALPFRPQRTTPVPSVRGVQLATVVGPSGEEIYTDKYGRIKVQFHWDREGQNDISSSCWMRVGTFWAGKNWGAIHIPRMGQEVVVAFEEGDVDHPIVVGSVYNADMMPPYTLPDKKTVSTVKSRSTKKGQPTNYNELRFEDLKGKEQVFFHAERDKDERVKKESREWVGGNRHKIVKQSQKEKVEVDKHSTIVSNYTEETGGNHHIHTKGNVVEKTDGKMSLTVGTSNEQKSGTKFAHEAGTEIHLKAGVNVVIEGGVQVTLKGPGGFVDISPAGVTIQGIMVLINSGGAAGSGSGSSPDSPDAPAAPDEADDGTKFDKM